MTQLSIFENKPNPHAKIIWYLYTDGASKNNPGQAGAGIYILKEEEIILKQGYYLGVKTNNQAEYLAMLLGIIFAKKYLTPYDKLEIKTDSELLVKQISGVYKIKNPGLLKIHKDIKAALSGINYNITHILRDKNKVADNLANQGVLKRIYLPQDLQEIIDKYE